MRSKLRALLDVALLIGRLRKHLRPGRGLVLATVVVSLLSAALEGVGVGLLIPLVDLLQQNPPPTGRFAPVRLLREALPGQSASVHVIVFCLLIIVAVSIKNVMTYASNMLGVRLIVRVSRNLRVAVFEAVLRADLSLFEQKKSGEMSSVFTTQMFWSVQAIEHTLIITQRTLLAAAYLTVLLALSWQVSLALLAVLALVAGFVGSLHAPARRRGQVLGEAYQRLGAFLSESFGGVRTVRVINAQEYERRMFEPVVEAVAQGELRGKALTSVVLPMAETLGMAGAMVVVAWAFSTLIVPGRLPSSVLMGIGLILIRLLPVQTQIVASYSQLAFSASGLREIERWLKSPAFPRRPFGSRSLGTISEAIRFESLDYTYPNGHVALHGISFGIPAGWKVALVGASGSGKSTIASLLLRLREPTGGRVLVDGIDYWEFTAASWHAQLGVVEQEPFLFHDTIERNIAYGREDVPTVAINTALRTANLDGFVASLPNGLHTVVGERGAMLSGGQKQRLAIARAVVQNPRLLILDEATSALDSASEREVQRALEEAMQGRTALVIAHRLSTVRNADHIVVLDEGRVVEQGTWVELMTRGGSFARLVELNELKG